MFRGVCESGQALIPVAVTTGDGVVFRLIAMIDTGATVTSISQSVARALGLLPMDNRKRWVKTAGGYAEKQVYKATLRLLGNNNVKSPAHDMQISGLPFEVGDFDMLLGTDILSQCCLIYRGREFLLVFDTDGEKTLQAAKAFLAPKKRGAPRA